MLDKAEVKYGEIITCVVNVRMQTVGERDDDPSAKDD